MKLILGLLVAVAAARAPHQKELNQPTVGTSFEICAGLRFLAEVNLPTLETFAVV